MVLKEFPVDRLQLLADATFHFSALEQLQRLPHQAAPRPLVEETRLLEVVHRQQAARGGRQTNEDRRQKTARLGQNRDAESPCERHDEAYQMREVSQWEQERQYGCVRPAQ